MLTLLRWSVVFGLILSGSPSRAAADPVARDTEHCVVHVGAKDRLNIRDRPAATARMVASKAYGQCGILVTGDCAGSWCPVEDGHVGGWVHRRYISMVSPALYCVHAVAAGDRLNLRAFPSASSRILARLLPNQCGIAFLPYSRGTWQKIRVDGTEGWVNRTFLSGQ